VEAKLCFIFLALQWNQWVKIEFRSWVF